jgi:hypothetical protein
MKFAFAPLAMLRSALFIGVCSTSPKCAQISRMEKCEKCPVLLGLLHSTRWSRASGAKPICSTAPLAPPPFRGERGGAGQTLPPCGISQERFAPATGARWSRRPPPLQALQSVANVTARLTYF